MSYENHIIPWNHQSEILNIARMNVKSSKAVHVVLSQWRDFKLIIIDVVFACCKCRAKFLKFKALERVSLLYIWVSSDSSFLKNHLEGFEGVFMHV